MCICNLQKAEIQYKRRLFSPSCNRVFEEFSNNYAGRILDYCKPLANIAITITQRRDVVHADEIPSPFEFSINNTNSACIMYDPNMIIELNLSKVEQMAAIAHEVGHIIYQFLDSKENEEEIFADTFACKIGFTDEMLSVLEKLSHSGWYSDAQTRFANRRLYISSYCKGNPKIDGVLK